MEDNEVINQYEIIKDLYFNEYYCVYLAQHTVTKIMVTMKRIRKENLGQGPYELLERELSLLRSADHPFISTLYEYFDDTQFFNICTEYVENGELSNYICDYEITEKQARSLFIQLISAIEYLHNDQKVIHKYLRHKNIMLDKNYNIRITEFDFYKRWCICDPWINHELGEERFVSPEIYQKKPYTEASEIWILGIILYSMVTKAYPFAEEGLGPTIEKIMTKNPKYPKNMSQKLIDLLSKMFNKNPDERITLKQIIEHPWLTEFEETELILKDFERIKSFKVVDNEKLDDEIINEMKALGYQTNGILQDLKENKIDKRTAVYKMYKREKMKCDQFFTQFNKRTSKK